MANNVNYEYVDETSIDPELICIICNTPFDDPLCTPCDHTYCRECITGWINGGNLSCPICRGYLMSIDNLVQASRTVRNIVDRLLVKCTLCEKTELQRCNFDEHMGRACPKIQVPCPSADIRCPWKGTRDQLNNHIATCLFHPFRTIISELVTENRQLKEQIKQLSDTVNKRLDSETSTNKKQLCENCRNCLYLHGDGGARDGYYHAIANSHCIFNDIQRIIEFRSRQPPPGNIDGIQYEDLMKDPTGTVHRIYDHFHFLQWSDEFEKAMQTWLINNPQGKQGRHTYSLDQFDLANSDTKKIYKRYEQMFLPD